MFGKRNRKTPFTREPAVELEDLRDDCVALYLNSGLSFQQVHANGGPTGPTVSKWLYKETRFPRLDTMRALARAVGGDIVVVGSQVAAQLQDRTMVNRLNVSATTAVAMNYAEHHLRQKQHRTHRNRSAFRKSANGSASAP
jgi:post-segregation antitoxin (ccd killing protein)